MEKLIQLTLEVRQLEESLHTCGPIKQNTGDEFDVKKLRFKSAVLTTAYNHLRVARMMCGDMLRLCGVEHPYKNSYVGKLESESPKYMENGGLKLIDWVDVTCRENMPNAYDDLGALRINVSYESLCLGYIRNSLGNESNENSLFYRLRDMYYDINNEVISCDINPNLFQEFNTYYWACMQALKLANCHLGLRFGELV